MSFYYISLLFSEYVSFGNRLEFFRPYLLMAFKQKIHLFKDLNQYYQNYDTNKKRNL